MYASVEMLLKFYAENFSSDRRSALRPPNTHTGTYNRIFQDGRIRIGVRVTLHASFAPIGFISLWLISQPKQIFKFSRRIFGALWEGI
jgi:hypothetical protein